MKCCGSKKATEQPTMSSIGKKAFIVYCHPEPKSFGNGLKCRAVETFEKMGMEVTVSDLYEMKFNPKTGQDNFKDLQNEECYNQKDEELHATDTNTYADDIAAEHKKIQESDFILFVFPIHWFSTPAILKGWFDRVLSNGVSYGGKFGMFEDGAYKGKRAMITCTTGAPEMMYDSEKAMNGDIHTQVLYPINRGTLAFCGWTVLPPFVAYSPAHCEEEDRTKYLADFEKHLTNWQEMQPLDTAAQRM
eukprot:TRINITY_DN6834_c0_g1_i1.p1 TRINITY_DN6834_c0_g1~~TRINITY_DN6834_c0_g1_i1.p1  ORF type:complete len:247 (-),score=67.80 TRINITY_DN6834_c0_g1_i1:10-750(-)